MATLVFDIETNPAAIDPAHMPAIETMAAKREQDVDTFLALFPPTARVVAIGAMKLGGGSGAAMVDGSLFPGAMDGDGAAILAYGEAELLREFFEHVAKCSGIITFNGRGYDIPVMLHRARILGVPAPAILTNAAWQKPWESKPHRDIMNELSFGGAVGRYSLAAWAIAYGHANPKASGDGAGVRALIESQDLARLVEYVMGDVRATAALAGGTQ